MKPDFYIVGAQKCGTTSLYKYLIQHPRILPAQEKEIHFFSDKFHLGYSWYEKQFPCCPPGCITGEATPYYMLHPHAAQRIQAWSPHAKIIMMLRNPVDRAFSHYRYHVKLGAESLSFAEAIEAEPARLQGERDKMVVDESYQGNNYKLYSYLARGVYIDQLMPWFELFPKDQILIMKSEDFFSNPKVSFDKTLAFLALPDYEISSFKKFNEGKQAPMGKEVRLQLLQYFRHHNQRLYDYIGSDFGWDIE